jgi:ubiquinone/menaquinone biosynthesis C-methylase UbiE
MEPENGNDSAILPVSRSKSDAKRFYDGISRIYDLFSEPFERKHVEEALALLSPEESESVLEVGFGTGHALKDLGERVGEAGFVVGLDISTGMVRAARKRLKTLGLADRVCLCCGDAGVLPFRGGVFDTSFMGFTLELFDTPEIPQVLNEVQRVLSAGGRFGVVSLSKEGGRSTASRLYAWAHGKWPVVFDCRPIYLEASLRDAGYEIITLKLSGMMGLPVGTVVAEKPLTD